MSDTQPENARRASRPGLVKMVTEARRASGKTVPILELVIAPGGDLIARRELHDEMTVGFAC